MTRMDRFAPCPSLVGTRRRGAALPMLVLAFALHFAVYPVHAVPIVPDAVTRNVAIQSQSERFTLADIAGPQHFQTFGFQEFGGEAFAFGSAAVTTLGFFDPIIAPNAIPSLGKVEAVTDAHSRNGSVRLAVGNSDAQVDFIFYLGLDGPGVTEVPVDIRAVGTHNVSVVRGNGNGSGQALIAAGEVIPGSTATLPRFRIATTDPGNGTPGGGSFAQTEQVMMAPGDVLQILLRAITSARASNATFEEPGDTLVTATVDPSFMIPLDVPQRDQFSFVVSANLPQETSSVPEPGSGLLIGLGLAALIGCNRWPRRTLLR